MAVRLNLGHAPEVREKIRVGVILDRLDKHMSGDLELTQTQLKAAEILLNKSLPNLQALTIAGDENAGPIKLETIFRWMREPKPEKS